jgi:predicted Zn-dependent protease
MLLQLGIQLGGMALSVALREKPEETRQLALTVFGVGSQLFGTLPYSRNHEYEADKMGLFFMAMAGYNPRQAPEFWKKMQALGGSSTPQFLSTHPSHGNRIDRLNGAMDEAMQYYKA